MAKKKQHMLYLQFWTGRNTPVRLGPFFSVAATPNEVFGVFVSSTGRERVAIKTSDGKWAVAGKDGRVETALEFAVSTEQ